MVETRVMLEERLQHTAFASTVSPRHRNIQNFLVLQRTQKLTLVPLGPVCFYQNRGQRLEEWLVSFASCEKRPLGGPPASHKSPYKAANATFNASKHLP
ncbi:hypothetical protein D3C79_898940 [compost metagenome]